MRSISPLILVRNISFSYGEELLFSKVDMDITPWDIYLIRWPSGVGKTTLLNLLGAIIKPQDWVIDYAPQLFPRELWFGYAFIDGPFFELLTVKENIFLLETFANSKIDSDYYQELVRYFEIESLETHTLISLSAGQRERVNFIRALVHNPRVVILDEPWSNLDSVLFEKLIDFIKMKSKKNHTSFIIVSHSNRFEEIATKSLGLTYT